MSRKIQRNCQRIISGLATNGTGKHVGNSTVTTGRTAPYSTGRTKKGTTGRKGGWDKEGRSTCSRVEESQDVNTARNSEVEAILEGNISSVYGYVT